MIEIKETGSYFETDSEGYLINPSSLDKIQADWQPLVDEIVDIYKDKYGDKLIAVYIRGSVAKGQAIKGVSDIDTLAYVELAKSDITYDWIEDSEKELMKQFSFTTGVELGADPMEDVESDQFLLNQAVCVWGKELQHKQFKLEKDVLRHCQHFERTMNWFDKKIEKGFPEDEVGQSCVWLCKQILRTAMELCVIRSGKYSRDLYRCWEVFTEQYPEQADNMKNVLYLSLNPTTDLNVVLELHDTWTPWLREEIEKHELE